jgi:hypothetical protein
MTVLHLRSLSLPSLLLQVALNKLEEHNVSLVLQQVSASAYEAAANATASVYEVCPFPAYSFHAVLISTLWCFCHALFYSPVHFQSSR